MNSSYTTLQTHVRIEIDFMCAKYIGMDNIIDFIATSINKNVSKKNSVQYINRGSSHWYSVTYLLLYLLIYFFIYLFTYSFTYLFTFHLFIYFFIYLHIYLFIYLHIYLFIYLFTYLLHGSHLSSQNCDVHTWNKSAYLTWHWNDLEVILQLCHVKALRII